MPISSDLPSPQADLLTYNLHSPSDTRSSFSYKRFSASVKTKTRTPREKKSIQRRCLVTGAGGFAGSHLVDLLLAEGHQISAALSTKENPENLIHLGQRIKRVRFDLTSPSQTARLLKQTRPDWIFHLAGFSSVGGSFSNERLTYDINFGGTLNILEAARSLPHLHKLIIISSADVYGAFSPKNKLLTEKQELAPISPYGISKVAAEHVGLLYHRNYGLPIVIMRPFNHIGPRQSDVFFLPAFCKQIALIEAGRQRGIIKVGDLSVRRDLSDVRDIVNGYLAAAERGTSGEIYHLCSGRTVKLESVLRRLLKKTDKSIKISVDKSRLRAADIPVLRGDNSKAAKELGWAPRYELPEALSACLDFWRRSVNSKKV